MERSSFQSKIKINQYVKRSLKHASYVSMYIILKNVVRHFTPAVDPRVSVKLIKKRCNSVYERLSPQPSFCVPDQNLSDLPSDPQSGEAQSAARTRRCLHIYSCTHTLKIIHVRNESKSFFFCLNVI